MLEGDESTCDVCIKELADVNSTPALKDTHHSSGIKSFTVNNAMNSASSIASFQSQLSGGSFASCCTFCLLFRWSFPSVFACVIPIHS